MMSQLKKEVIGRVPSGNMFRENKEQLLQSSGLTCFDETPYRVIRLTTFDGEKHQVITIVASAGSYLICEFFGQLGGNTSQYTIGGTLFNSADVDIEIVKKFYAEKWFSKGSRVLDFLRESTFVDVDLILIDDGLEQKINELWNRRHLPLFGKEDKEVIRTSIACLDYGTYRIVKEVGDINEILASCKWLQRAVILYKKYYAEVAHALSTDKAPFGAHLSEDTHLESMVSVDVGAYIGAHTIIENYVLIHTGVQIGKNCHIGSGSVIGNSAIAPSELPTIIGDNSIIGENAVIGTGIIFPKYIRIGAGVCLENRNSVVFDRVRGHTVECHNLAPGSVVVMGTINPHTKLVCPCVISYDELPQNPLIQSFLS